ncbi:hypothetical protein IVB14_21480 [Bradyrhizobium sp. 180]|uniref:hypothetical protein n=1 Tax=unclassified Bradyrhizobium TaxID=2631580 RepID=UPI001FFA9F04|nr:MULTISPECIES: hypothetical protein [unclassified Bradyrhizobium]MCK1492927.1 hypothetical protein [Bradyrhizobium sp. 180]MCK1616634.1 hypothetical protein [Bradyrhizobium sp. 159]MCK1665204.1 hypothetical protein [Bradyrhizobium sp. 153]
MGQVAVQDRPSAPAIADRHAGGAVEQMIVAKPILHVQAGPGALEDDLTVHAR